MVSRNDKYGNKKAEDDKVKKILEKLNELTNENENCKLWYTNQIKAFIEDIGEKCFDSTFKISILNITICKESRYSYYSASEGIKFFFLTFIFRSVMRLSWVDVLFRSEVRFLKNQSLLRSGKRSDLKK